MTITSQIAKHLREVHVGGNWTSSNLKENLADLSWKEATTKMGDHNSIAALVFHMNYFVRAVLMVMKGDPLNAHDKHSFDLPSINNETDWQQLVSRSLADAEALAKLIETMPDVKLGNIFAMEKYGNYYRNLQGLIEHTHYHLGQIATLKKMIRSAQPDQ